MTIDDIVGALVLAKFRYNSEAELQAGISVQLTHHKINHVREMSIGEGERIDFVVPIPFRMPPQFIGIEVKARNNHNRAALLRQIQRYCQCEGLTELLVVTDKPLCDIPKTFNGKKITTHFIMGGIW